MDNRTDKRITGDIGESIAATFLVKRGFSVIQRNYSKKVGEIDIICKKGETVYFVEVKTLVKASVSRETGDSFRPEDNIHPGKIKRMERAIQTYIGETDYEGEWEIIAVAVELNKEEKTARVRLLDDLAW